MRLVHIADAQDKKNFPDGDGYSVKTLRFDIKREFPDLQVLIEKIAIEHQYDGVILSAKLDNELEYRGLEVAMRIRLSWATIKDKAFVSLFIYTPELSEDIYKQQMQFMELSTATVLLTTGTFIFNSIDGFSVLAGNPAKYRLLNEENFRQQCLEVLKVNKPVQVGNHALANILGVIRLAIITGNTSALEHNEFLARFNSNMYVK